MRRVRGKKRMEIIKNFLEGKDDPKYEVIPTVTEGKIKKIVQKEKSNQRVKKKKFRKNKN